MDETRVRHDRSLTPNPLPEGEGDAVSLRENRLHGARVIPIRSVDPGAGKAHAQLRVYQVFVNVEGIKLRKRGLMRLVSLLTAQRHGFYAVMLVAAEEGSLPPLLLSLVRDTLMEEFAPLSFTPPESWQIKLVDWRVVGMAPPMFQQTGCIDQDWGAAWYDQSDEVARQHRYRLTKVRLWKGHRARPKRTSRPPETSAAAGAAPAPQPPVEDRTTQPSRA